MAKPFAWSYSVLTSFETCPLRHKLTKITKEVSEGQSDAMAWGNRVHKAFELRIRDHAVWPKGLEVYEPMAKIIESRGVGGVVQTEQKLGLDQNYQPCGYFGPTIWVRMITDVTITKPDKRRVFVGDYKTGNKTPASAQLKLCAAGTLAEKPYIDEVVTAFIWLKDGTTTHEKYTRDDIPAIWNEFHPRVQRLEHAVTADLFPARPSGLCAKHCPVPNRMCSHSGHR